jgi:RNA polymerase sigma-70 factor (ECF subfamily)
MKDIDVVKNLKQGDKAAFSILYEHYWEKIYNFTHLYITTSIDLEEIVQEVFIKLWDNRHQIDEHKNLDNFLFILTRNLIFNHSRRHFNENNFKMTVLRTLNDTYDLEEELIATDLKEYIFSLISRLPPRQKEVFELSRQQGLSNREIAERLHITEKSVERNINLALQFLRKNLNPKISGLSIPVFLNLIYTLYFTSFDLKIFNNC